MNNTIPWYNPIYAFLGRVVRVGQDPVNELGRDVCLGSNTSVFQFRDDDCFFRFGGHELGSNNERVHGSNRADLTKDETMLLMLSGNV